MADETYQVRRMKLDESDANRLGKLASLWTDLIHVDMVLLARTEVPDVAANVFHRRALWESAIVSYGRMAVSEKRRNVDYEELLRAARGDRGVEFHETLMGWRHDHVAHRKSRSLESVAVYADYLDEAPDVLDSIRVSVSPSGGPADDSPLVVEFCEHIKTLRDKLWEKYLAPVGELIATRGPRGVLEPADRAPSDGLTVEQTLWSRVNGTGIGDQERRAEILNLLRGIDCHYGNALLDEEAGLTVAAAAAKHDDVKLDRINDLRSALHQVADGQTSGAKKWAEHEDAVLRALLHREAEMSPGLRRHVYARLAAVQSKFGLRESTQPLRCVTRGARARRR